MQEGKNARGKQWKLLKFSRSLSPSHNSTCSGSRFKPLSCGSILWPNKSVESNTTPTPRPSSPAPGSSHGNTIHSIELYSSFENFGLSRWFFNCLKYWSLPLPNSSQWMAAVPLLQSPSLRKDKFLCNEELTIRLIFKFQKVVHSTTWALYSKLLLSNSRFAQEIG